MKNKFKLLGIILVSLFIFPITAKALEYNTLNFKEVLADEAIEEKFADYKETKDQITIYLFRGKGCGYCRAYLTFMNSIAPEYGKYFKMVSYEVWNDENNSNLMSEVSNFLGQPAGGVPYIVIGDKVFPGYTDDYDEDIKAAIMNLYNTKAKKRYDVMKALKRSKNALSNTTLFMLNILFVIIATCGIIYYVNNKVKELNTKIENLVIKERESKKTAPKAKKQVSKKKE